MTMKKKVLASLVATMAVGATCAFAANPFVDVPSDSWAYNAVVQLADAGIINGVDGKDFQGNRQITRYEAAEMTAKAMAHEDKATVEQRALINKLADEFADELNSLGVRVTNLENRVGNVKLTGDFRLRYMHQSDGFVRDNDSKNAGHVTGDQFDYRARLRANAYVNDNTKVVFGISSNNKSFNNDTQADTENSSVFTDDAYVTSNFGSHFNVQAGRWDTYLLGNGMGLQYGDVFDGGQAQYKGDHFTLTGGYGQFKEGAGYSGSYTDKDGHTYYNNGSIAYNNLNNGGPATHSLVGVKTGYGELEANFDRVGAGVYYNSFNGDKAIAQNLSSLWGGYLKFNLGTKWNLIGDYQKVKKENELKYDQNAALWGAQLTYGTASFEKKGSWDAWVAYVNADPNSLYGSTNFWTNNNLLDNAKTWSIGADYVVAKNTKFSVYQTLSSKLKDNTYGDKDPNEQTRAEFVFVF